MRINPYVKKWCDEDYDIRKEDFYVENAHYVADREWAIGGFKHGLFSWLVAVVAVIANGSFDVPSVILNAMTAFGVSAVCFWFFGIRRYDANYTEISTGLYFSLAVVLFVLLGKASVFEKILFIVPSMLLCVYLFIINPLKFLKTKAKMKARIIQEEAEEDQNAKQSYARWESEYKTYRYGLPASESFDSDPKMVEARKLFEGYTDNKSMLKARYRELTKKYHPDKGGETRLFQCIIEVYEEVGKSLS